MRMYLVVFVVVLSAFAWVAGWITTPHSGVQKVFADYHAKRDALIEQATNGY